MKNIGSKSILLVSLALVSTNTVFADKKAKADLMTGASTLMLANTCAGCHGPNGVSTGPSIPSIAGNSTFYFEDVMERYKTGEIPSTIMGRLAKGYSKAEIKQMAKYFSEQKYVGATGQKSDSTKAEEGAKLHEKYCEKCHSEAGTLAEDEAGFLKGQWKAYLAAQMMDFQNKDRKAPKKMAKKLKKLHKKHGPAGIEALIEYYSQ